MKKSKIILWSAMICLVYLSGCLLPETSTGIDFDLDGTHHHIIVAVDFIKWDDMYTAQFGFSFTEEAALSLPLYVESGTVYSAMDAFFSFTDEQAEYYCADSYENPPFTLTVDVWEGSGGIASGTFSGQVAEGCTGPYHPVTNGRFNCSIK